MEINFNHETKLRVRYGETDQMGYCYYGNFAQFFEVGRVEAMRAIGMSYKELEGKGIMLPVSEFHVHYKSPAIYDDELTIITTIANIKGPRIQFNYIIKKGTDQLVATASTTLVFVNKATMRPIQAPDVFKELIQQYITHSS